MSGTDPIPSAVDQSSPGPSPKSQGLLPFRINLSTEPYGFIQFLKWGCFLVSVILIGVLVMGVKHFQEVEKDMTQVQASVKRLMEQQNAVKATFEGDWTGSRREGDILKEVDFANKLLKRKSFSWSSFFGELEAVVPRSISVSRVQPEGKDNGVQVEGKSLSLKRLTEFILSLEQSPHFDTIFLANQKKDKEGRIQFLITFRYVE